LKKSRLIVKKILNFTSSIYNITIFDRKEMLNIDISYNKIMMDFWKTYSESPLSDNIRYKYWIHFSIYTRISFTSKFQFNAPSWETKYRVAMWLCEFTVTECLEPFHSDEMMFMHDLRDIRINPFPYNAGHS